MKMKRHRQHVARKSSGIGGVACLGNMASSASENAAAASGGMACIRQHQRSAKTRRHHHIGSRRIEGGGVSMAS